MNDTLCNLDLRNVLKSTLRALCTNPINAGEELPTDVKNTSVSLIILPSIFVISQPVCFITFFGNLNLDYTYFSNKDWAFSFDFYVTYVPTKWSTAIYPSPTLFGLITARAPDLLIYVQYTAGYYYLVFRNQYKPVQDTLV
jgi:hypothetical protein